jgi:hypothetical protein
MSTSKLEEIVIDYISGIGAHRLAEKHGFSTATIWRHLRKAGVTIRPQFGPQKTLKTDFDRAAYRKSYRLKVKKKIQAVIAARLDGAKCIDCGYDNFIALEFDHRIPEEKSFEISAFLARSVCSETALKNLKMEMDKCDIVCRNCHAIRTAKKFGSWRMSAG